MCLQFRKYPHDDFELFSLVLFIIFTIKGNQFMRGLAQQNLVI